MKLAILKKPAVIIAGCVIGIFCLIQWLHLSFPERLENITYDMRVRAALHSSPVVATNLAFVAISDNTINMVNNYNDLGLGFGLYWPRHVYGRVIRELAARGAKAVAMDVMFPNLRSDFATVLIGDDAISSDEWFGRQIHEAGQVILGSEPGTVPPPLFRTNALALGNISTDKDADGVLRRAQAFVNYREWHWVLQQIEDRHPELGLQLSKSRIETRGGSNVLVIAKVRDENNKEQDPVILPLEKDGTYDVAHIAPLQKGMERYAKPFTDKRVWHMGIVLAAQELKLDLEHPIVELDQGRITLNGPGVTRVIPVDKDGFFLVNWALPLGLTNRVTGAEILLKAPFEGLLAEYLVRNKLNVPPLKTDDIADLAKFCDGKDWTNKLVVIGSIASGNELTDRGATPLEKDTIFVSKHWNVANSVLTGRFIHVTPAWVDYGLIIFMGLLAAGLTAWFRSYQASIWLAAISGVYVAAAFFIYAKSLLFIPVVLPLACGPGFTHGALMLYLYMFEQRDKRKIRTMFSKMVSEDIAQEMLKENVPVEGARVNVTVFFSDIRGFTEMTDVTSAEAEEYVVKHGLTGEAAEAVREKSAREALKTVNSYLKVIADMVIKNNGTVDKFIGDCVMAFWGAPVPNPKHAQGCVQAAIDAQRAVHAMNLGRDAENKKREEENMLRVASGQEPLPMLRNLVVGSGINTGTVTAGLMGTEDRISYTVFGRDVNLASRLESVSGRARIVISLATMETLQRESPEIAAMCNELPPVHVKGIKDDVRNFEVIWRQKEIIPGLDLDAEQPDPTINTSYFNKGETAG